MPGLQSIILTALDLFFFAVLAWVILSWVQVSAVHPLGRLRAALDRLVYPLILPIRRVIPPIRIGGGGLDLSPIVLLIGVRVVRGLVRGLF